MHLNYTAEGLKTGVVHCLQEWQATSIIHREAVNNLMSMCINATSYDSDYSFWNVHLLPGTVLGLCLYYQPKKYIG